MHKSQSPVPVTLIDESLIDEIKPLIHEDTEWLTKQRTGL